MTITSIVAITGRLPGDGANFSFAFDTKIFANSELRVYHTVTATGVETLLTEGTTSADYSVATTATAAVPAAGTITYPATSTGAIPSTETITIKRVIVKDQQTDLVNQGGYFPSTLEGQFDKFVMMVQDLQEQVDRCLKVQTTESGITNTEINSDGTFTAGQALQVASSGSTFVTAGAAAAADASASDVTPVDVHLTSGSAGVGTDFSRFDHRHLLPTTIPRLALENIYTETQIWAKGGDVTAANALDLDAQAGNIWDITGNTAITSIGTIGIGTIAILQFDGTPVLTHHVTNLILPGGQNILMQAGDIVELYEYATADWRLISHVHGTATNGRMPGPDFESTAQSLNNDAQITVAHSMSRTPSKVEVLLRANTATAQGWADNEEMVWPSSWQGVAADDLVDITFDGTNVYITQGLAIQLLDHGSFNAEAITQSEYEWIVRCWA